MRRTLWYRDRHVWSAVAALALGLALRHAPPAFRADAVDVYACLVATGIIAARRQVKSKLSLSKDQS